MTAIHKKDMTEFEKGVLHGAQQERKKREEVVKEIEEVIKQALLEVRSLATPYNYEATVEKQKYREQGIYAVERKLQALTQTNNSK